MKTFIRFLSLASISLICIPILSKQSLIDLSITSIPSRESPIKVAVINNMGEEYPAEISKYLKEIENREKDKINFTIFDSTLNQNTENELLSTVLNNKEYSAILLNLVDANAAQSVIDKTKNSNLPIILFQREPISMNSVKSYSKSIFIGSDPEEVGTLQGKALAYEWNKRKETIDQDRDNIMQYILLKGTEKNLNTIGRSKTSVHEIIKEGIKVYELASKICNWEREEAKKNTEILLGEFGDKIEVVNSNNDAMAIGAIEALQSYGYNKGGNTRTIPVVGVDGIQEAKNLIDQGIMANTVIIDAKDMAEALSTSIMNMAQRKSPIEGTNYKFDESGVAIRIPVTLYRPLD